MLSIYRILNNIEATQTVIEEGLEGDIVEIGIYKGGSSMAMIQTAKELGSFLRTFHLYDTFDGMTPASEHDTLASDGRHFNTLIESKDDFFNCRSRLEEVRANVGTIGYPSEKIEYHVGDICKNTFVPEKIAILRLDTDFYESTRHELEQFYDAVVPGGYIIIDDYGFWKGCRKAVDEWLEKKGGAIQLISIDDTGVYFRKPSAA